MKLIFKNWLLLALCLFQYANGSSDHRRDGPIPYPIRLMDPIPLLQLPSKRDSSNNAHPFTAMQFPGPIFSDSMMPFHNNQPQQSAQTINFRSQAEKPFSQQFHGFESTDRDAATPHDRRTSADFILSALQSSNFNPLLPSSSSATKDSSPEARLDRNVPFANSNRQPDNLRDYAFLEDSEDHRIPISITAPIPTILTHPATRSTKLASSRPQTSTTKNPQTSSTISSRVKKTQTSTSNNVRFPQTSQSKSSNRNQTKNETARSELRMNSNNLLNQHHEIKRSPQQELLYTPSFRRRNNANAASIFNNFNNNPNSGTTNFNNNPNSGTNSFQYNTGSRNSGNRGYENNGGYGIPPQKLPNRGNANNHGISSSNSYANNNQPNLNNGGYDVLNNDYNNQQLPFGDQGVYSNSQFPMHANNYNFVPIFAPHLPLTYRNQQPTPLNAYSGLNSIAYPFHLIPAGALIPNYLTAPPAFASLSMVNPSSPGVLTTSPVLANYNNLNLVNPFLKLYSQPLISSVPAMPAPLMLAPIPYGRPLPTAPIYRNTNFQPDFYSETQRPFPNQFDHHDDDNDDDDDDSDHHQNGFNNEQNLNYLPPIYISNNGNQNQGNFQSSSPFIPINSNEQSSNPIYNQGSTGNTATPGLISDSFPPFQPGVSFPSSSGEPANYDADFVDRPKKVHRNRVKSGNRYNEETTSTRPNTNGFGNKVTQHIPRVEPAEGRANKDMTGVNRLLLPQNSTDMNSTTTTDSPLVTFTTELPTTSIVINNITLEEIDTDGTDDNDNDHINITITEPAATTINIAQDRISDLLPNHQSSLYVGFPLTPDSTISIKHQPFQGYSINNPFLSNILKSRIESVISPTTISIENNFMKETHSCTDLFGRKIPNCKIAPTFVPKSKNNKLRSKNKSFNPQLFEIVEGGVFTEPTHQNIYFQPSYISPPSHTIPVSQFERLLYHDDFENDHEAMSETPEILPKQFPPFYSPLQRPRSMTYNRHSALIAQGHPASMKTRFN